MNEFVNIEEFVVDESFQDYVAGTSEESVIFWENWILNNPERKEDIKKAFELVFLLTNAKKKNVTVDRRKTFDSIWREISKSDKKVILSPFWIRVAASIAVIVGFSLAWTWMTERRENIRNTSFQEIIVPIGEKTQVIMPDGSHVWINSGSRFRYPTKFGDITREVHLVGEAFFEVSYNKSLPFIVKTKNSLIKVLGTAFNVKSYPEDSKTQTTVVRGLVHVKNLETKKTFLVRPRQMLVFDNKTVLNEKSKRDNISSFELLEKVNVEPITSWKDQLLVFSNEPLEDMVLKMERWFNYKIVIEDSTLKKERYNGKFVHNENIFQVLEIIKLTTPISYKVQNSTEIIIKRNK